MFYYIKNKTDKPVAIEELVATVPAKGTIGPYDDMVLRKIAGPRHDILFVPVVAEGKKPAALELAESPNESALIDESVKSRRRKV
jgi:hypothetical protein